MKKRKHHYVWRNYLRSWSNKDKIWAKINGQVLNVNLEKIANERDFYQIKDLNIDDIGLINKLFLDNMPDHLKRLNKNWVDIFHVVVTFRNRASRSGIPRELQDEFDRVVYNFEEEVQTKIEISSIQYLEKISSGDISFYNNADDNISFNYYLSLQYFRTSKIKNAILEVAAKYPQYNVDRIWNIVMHIFATNMGFGLYQEREQLRCILMNNNTDLPLIAGDQPIINTYSAYNDDKEKLTHDQFELYYPQNPKLGLLITKKADFENAKNIQMDIAMVEKYNNMIYSASGRQVYANQEEVLNKYIEKHPTTRL